MNIIVKSIKFLTRENDKYENENLTQLLDEYHFISRYVHDLLIEIFRLKVRMFFRFYWKIVFKWIIISSLLFSSIYYSINFISPKIIKREIFVEKPVYINVPSTSISPEFKNFMYAIALFESGDDYSVRRANSQYLGRYQIGDIARKSIGFEGLNNERGYQEFLNSKELQDAAMYMLVKSNYNCLKEYIKQYNGRRVGRYYLTTSGIIAMAHSSGCQSVINFIKSNGKIVAKDGNGIPMTDYLQFNNYKLF